MERRFFGGVFLLLFLGFSSGRVIILDGWRPDVRPADGMLQVRGAPPDVPSSPAIVKRTLWGRQSSCDAGYGYCSG